VNKDHGAIQEPETVYLAGSLMYSVNYVARLSVLIAFLLLLPCCLSIPGKMMEQLILEVIKKQV